MSVLLKRSDPESHIPNECHKTCGTLYGKNVKIKRRTAKRSAKQKFRLESKNL